MAVSLLCHRCNSHMCTFHKQTHAMDFGSPHLTIRVDLPYCLCVCWQLASGIYSFACSLWSHHTDCFLQQIYTRDEAAAVGSLERTLLSLKGGNTCTPLHCSFPHCILTHSGASDPILKNVKRTDCLSHNVCIVKKPKKSARWELLEIFISAAIMWSTCEVDLTLIRS